MPGDATILEGPVTPAPLFAYRAIRSIFFASPDSSPENYNYNHNKENIIPTYADSPKNRRITTPSKKRQKDEGHVANGGVLLSPTKGILRTPGLATPRAKFLRDVNVKFKSVSPEVRRSEAVAADQSPSKKKALVAPTQAVRLPKATNDLAPVPQIPAPETQVSQIEGLDTSVEKTTYPLAPAALDAYIAQTEKEMKRLIRYGKKMREYALGKDLENQELRLMVEKLRNENERLGNGALGSTDIEKDRNLLHAPAEEGSNGRERRTKTGGTILRKAVSPALRNKHRGHVREEVDRVETTVRGQVTKPRPARSSSLNRKPAVSAIAPTSSPTDKLSRAATSKQLSDLQTTDCPSTSVPGANAVTKSGTLRLPPDRVVAVRERLRKRAEARKASAEIEAAQDDNEDPHARDDGAVTLRKQLVEEASDLWADL